MMCSVYPDAPLSRIYRWCFDHFGKNRFLFTTPDSEYYLQSLDSFRSDAMHEKTPTPNHALQRTATAVTARASTAAFPPAMHGPRQPPPSLSLGSLGVATHSH